MEMKWLIVLVALLVHCGHSSVLLEPRGDIEAEVCLCTFIKIYTMHVYRVQQKSSNVLVIFLAIAKNSEAKFYMYITYSNLKSFSCNRIVISHVHVQQNVRRRKRAPRLRCRITHGHSNNRIANLY